MASSSKMYVDGKWVEVIKPDKGSNKPALTSSAVKKEHKPVMTPTGILIASGDDVSLVYDKDSTPRIQLMPTAYEKLIGYVYGTDVEVALLGFVERNGYVFSITDFILFEQSASTTSSELNIKSLGDAVVALIEEGVDTSRLKCIAHSHPFTSSKPSWSHTDDECCEEFCSDFLVSLLLNQHGHIVGRLDVASPIKVTFDKLPVYVNYGMSEDVTEACRKEVEEKVKRETVVTSYGGNYGACGSYGSYGYQSSFVANKAAKDKDAALSVAYDKEKKDGPEVFGGVKGAWKDGVWRPDKTKVVDDKATVDDDETSLDLNPDLENLEDFGFTEMIGKEAYRLADYLHDVLASLMEEVDFEEAACDQLKQGGAENGELQVRESLLNTLKEDLYRFKLADTRRNSIVGIELEIEDVQERIKKHEEGLRDSGFPDVLDEGRMDLLEQDEYYLTILLEEKRILEEEEGVVQVED